MVVEVRPGPYIGLIDAHNQGWIHDMGIPGPNAGKGDKVVILPPNYKGKEPAVELYMGPSKPAATPEENWIQTLRGRGFMIAVRLYGTNATFYDQKWRPDDVVMLR